MKLTILTLALLFTATSATARQVPFIDDNPDTQFAPQYTFVDKPIDKDVLSLCGDWGDKVSGQDIQSLFERHPEITKRLLSVDNSLTKQLLVKMWTRHDGFTHIFCGERESNGRLGGLHYAPRYKDLFEKNIISMCPPDQNSCFHKNNEAVPEKGIYSIPVSYINIDNQWKLKQFNGYNIEMNADEILYQATKGYFQLAGRKSCFYKIPETADHPEHYAVIVSLSNQAITTFYPIGPIGRKNNTKRYGTEYCQH